MGLDVFRAEVEKLLGWSLAPARPYTFDRNIDDFGWATGENGKHNFMMFIENGRVQNEPGRVFKKGLREIAKVHKGTFRMTTNQHLMLADIPTEEVPRVKALLAEYKLDHLDFSGLRLSSSACVAFPTCGLAMAESERVRRLCTWQKSCKLTCALTVFACAYQQSRSDLRGIWPPKRLDCYANDRLSKRLCATVCSRSRLRRQSTWKLPDVTGWWIPRTTTEQNLSR